MRHLNPELIEEIVAEIVSINPSEIFWSLEQTDDERNIKIIFKWAIIDIWFNMQNTFDAIFYGINTIRIRLDENNSLITSFSTYDDLLSKLERTIQSIEEDDFIQVEQNMKYTLIEY